MFFKLPLNSDLSKTSYALCEEIDGYYYICYNDGFISDAWEEISLENMEILFPDYFNHTESNQLSQLDRIEIAIEKSNAELRQEGADALTEELIESGVL